jgi:hypothetical protein
MQFLKTLLTVLPLFMAAMPAYATTAPINVPEPGSLGLLAAGAAAVAVAYRLRRRK